MRAGFEYYRATPADVAHNNKNKKTLLVMPVLALGDSGGKGRGMQVLENMRELASDVRGREIAACGHWLPEEQPETVARDIVAFFTEAPEH